MFGIRTPVKGKGAGAGSSGFQEPTSPVHPRNGGPSGVREEPKGISLKFGKGNATRGTLAKTEETPLSSSVGSAGATAPTNTPSPVSSKDQAQDAARTFIRRPERKRRSVDNMDIYKTMTYDTLTSSELLQEVMKTFEDIPAKVKGYPQMRKDIKTYLEYQSDKCLRTCFELSKRMNALETAPKVAPPAGKTVPTPESSEETLERLREVEATIKVQLSDLENRIAKGLKDVMDHVSDSGSDVIDKVIDRVDEAISSVGAVNINMTGGLDGVGRAVADLGDRVGGIAGDVAAVAGGVKEALTREYREPKNEERTYANVAAAKPWRRPALHSIAVTLEGGLETADEVLARVKTAVDARSTGLKISRIRKAKNQTVILGCDTEADLQKIKDRIGSQGEGLVVAHMTNKNPLVVLKDVFLDSDDDGMVSALHCQNKEIFMGLDQREQEMKIKYKKRTKNPKTAHVVVQVAPVVWQRMTGAGALYLDLQRVRVEDQSPLIQCTKCLAFGHGRKFCAEGVDRCSHCGGPHLREKCADYIAGNLPRCCNCSHSKQQGTDHNAFSAECPVRQKWDYLARANTAYP